MAHFGHEVFAAFDFFVSSWHQTRNLSPQHGTNSLWLSFVSVGELHTAGNWLIWLLGHDSEPSWLSEM
jgi:hypothetical protein